MESRRSQPDIHTMDRALQQMQRELESLRLQLSERSTSGTRQQRRGDNLGGFARTARGLRQISIRVLNGDFLGLNGVHYAMRSVRPVEITEAWWYPHDDKALSPLGYSFIRIYEHTDGADPFGGRTLGYIAGRAKTFGAFATGPIALGSAYPFDLEPETKIPAGRTVVARSNSTSPAAAWPDGDVILMWRWL